MAGYEVELLETHPLIDGNTTKVPPDASLRNSAQKFQRPDYSSNSHFARSDFETVSFLSRKPAASLGEVPFANKVSYRGGLGVERARRLQNHELGGVGGVPIGTF